MIFDWNIVNFWLLFSSRFNLKKISMLNAPVVTNNWHWYVLGGSWAFTGESWVDWKERLLLLPIWSPAYNSLFRSYVNLGQNWSTQLSYYSFCQDYKILLKIILCRMIFCYTYRCINKHNTTNKCNYECNYECSKAGSIYNEHYWKFLLYLLLSKVGLSLLHCCIYWVYF